LAYFETTISVPIVAEQFRLFSIQVGDTLSKILISGNALMSSAVPEIEQESGRHVRELRYDSGASDVGVVVDLGFHAVLFKQHTMVAMFEDDDSRALRFMFPGEITKVLPVPSNWSIGVLKNVLINVYSSRFEKCALGDIVLCDGSTEFANDSFANSLPSDVYVAIKSRFVKTECTGGKGDVCQFNCPETATFSDIAGDDPIIVRVNGKDLSGFLCVELFKRQPHKIELFPAVLKHRFEIQGIRFFFEVRHGMDRSDLQKVLSARLQIEKEDFDVFCGDRKLNDRAGTIDWPLVREAQTFQLLRTGNVQQVIHFVNADTGVELPEQVFELAAKQKDIVRQLKAVQPGDYRFYDAQKEISIDGEELAAETWVRHTPVPFRC
jgi:hypothetical protein